MVELQMQLRRVNSSALVGLSVAQRATLKALLKQVQANLNSSG